jgi:hypothetical protein
MPKTLIIKVRIDKDQEETLQKKADMFGLSIGQYMRFIALNADIQVKLRPVTQKSYNPYK